MVYVFLPDVLYAEVVYNESERYRSGFMIPETRSIVMLEVAVGFEPST